MLYLTNRYTNEDYMILWTGFVASNERRVLVNRGIVEHALWKWCIIDIDELEACALTLKGVMLFKVREVMPISSGSLYDGEAFIVDMEALLEYRRNNWFS